MNNQFKIGDVVQLKSGSVKMTVYYIDNNSMAVMYFNHLTNSFVTVRDLTPSIFDLAD